MDANICGKNILRERQLENVRRYRIEGITA